MLFRSAVAQGAAVVAVNAKTGANALLPHVRASQGMQYINPQGQLLLERKPATAAGMHGWANNYLFHQPDVERILRNGLAAHPSVQVRLQHEVTGVQPDPAGVDIHMTDLARDQPQRLRAQWVLGCDGARSKVREHMATGFDDLGLHQAWLVIDVELRQDLDLPVATVQYCNPARPITYVNVTGRRRRWEVMVMPGDNVSIGVKLIAPIAMEEKLRFAIREGGRTVGAGVVASIIA